MSEPQCNKRLAKSGSRLDFPPSLVNAVIDRRSRGVSEIRFVGRRCGGKKWLIRFSATEGDEVRDPPGDSQLASSRDRHVSGLWMGRGSLIGAKENAWRLVGSTGRCHVTLQREGHHLRDLSADTRGKKKEEGKDHDSMLLPGL